MDGVLAQQKGMDGAAAAGLALLGVFYFPAGADGLGDDGVEGIEAHAKAPRREERRKNLAAWREKNSSYGGIFL